jgi:hypothetical protein
VADKPIPFSGPMVRALLAGTKTQTRRLVMSREEIDRGPWLRVRAPSEEHGWQVGLERFNSWKSIPVRFAVGDRLYVREHWRINKVWDAVAPRDLGDVGPIHYEADQGLRYFTGRFRQGMHMPKRFSRITLHVTEVRVQRLQDISEEDALAEGVMLLVNDLLPNPVRYVVEDLVEADSPRDAYAALWNSINGPGSWDTNPWVTATTFEVEKINIEHARAA